MYADEFNAGYMPSNRAAEQITRVRAQCEAIGRNPAVYRTPRRSLPGPPQLLPQDVPDIAGAVGHISQPLITSAARGKVHISLGEPLASAPLLSALSTFVSCAVLSLGRRPARPFPSSATLSLHLPPVRDALMTYAQLAGPVCRDHPRPKQGSHSHAPRFHRLSNHAAAEAAAESNLSVQPDSQPMGPYPECVTEDRLSGSSLSRLLNEPLQFKLRDLPHRS